MLFSDRCDEAAQVPVKLFLVLHAADLGFPAGAVDFSDPFG